MKLSQSVINRGQSLLDLTLSGDCICCDRLASSTKDSHCNGSLSLSLPFGVSIIVETKGTAITSSLGKRSVVERRGEKMEGVQCDRFNRSVLPSHPGLLVVCSSSLIASDLLRCLWVLRERFTGRLGTERTIHWNIRPQHPGGSKTLSWAR